MHDNDEFEGWIKAPLSRGYPWLVARVGGRIVGYAYASPLKDRAAYVPNVEISIYLDMGERRKDYGRRLYAGWRTACACRICKENSSLCHKSTG